MAGCLDSIFGDGETSSTLTRSIIINLDEDSMEELWMADTPEDAMAILADTFFVYTHDGAATPAVDVIAEFIDEAGRAVKQDFTTFTGNDMIEAGDQVTIKGALMSSPMRILAGGAIVAERGHDAPDWLEAAGVPMPIALSDGAMAQWAFDSSIEASANLDEAGYTETGSDYQYQCSDPEDGSSCSWQEVQSTEEFTIKDAEWRASSSVDGTIRLSDTSKGVDALYDIESLSSIFAQATMTVRSTQDGETTEETGTFGVDGEFRMLADALGRLRMVGDEVTHAGGQMSYSTSGHLYLWDDETPRSEAPDLMEGESWPADAFPYEEEAVPDEDAPEDEVALLRDFYAMDVQAGDAFSFVLFVEEPQDDLSFQMSIDINVAAKETVNVAAGKVPALRIVTHVSIDAQLPDVGPQRLDFDGITHWIHAEQFIPVLMEADLGELIDDEELADALLELGGLAKEYGVDVELPSDLGLSFTGGGGLELAELTGSVHMPALFWATGYLSSALMPALMFVMVSDLGSYEEYELPSFPMTKVMDAEAAVSDGAQDALLILEHRGGDGVSVFDYDFQVNGQSVVARNGECMDWASEWYVGDTICLTEDGYTDIVSEAGSATLTIIHWPSSSIVFERAIAVS